MGSSKAVSLSPRFVISVVCQIVLASVFSGGFYRLVCQIGFFNSVFASVYSSEFHRLVCQIELFNIVLASVFSGGFYCLVCQIEFFNIVFASVFSPPGLSNRVF